MIKGMLFVCLMFLSACSLLPGSSMGKEDSIPVYLDSNSFLQIFYPEETHQFPFETGDSVEIKGTLIYHGINDWVTSELLPDAKWHASIYPNGDMLSFEDERLIVLLNDPSGQREPFEIEWPIDNDTRFVIISDKPMPKRWFETLEIGNSTQVCFSLAVEVQKDTESSSVITFRPVGEIVDNLILTEVRKCQ
jgi:hypothetical protein